MSSFVFPGHPAYVAAAAVQIERPEAARDAGRLGALTSLANLCAQASRAEPGAVAGILAKAAEFRDQLAIALRAADAMLADVAAARAIPGSLSSEPEPAEVLDPPPAIGAGRPTFRKAAKEVAP